MRMIRRSAFTIATMGALGLTFGGAHTASAFWWGSHGSDGGSHGSSGGSHGFLGGLFSSLGSHGSDGGSHGSSGGYGSSGGGYGSSGGGYGSSGGWSGSSGGGYGSSGGAYGSDGGYHVASLAGTTGATPETRVAYLNLSVPANARVYLQNQPMTLTGTARRFVTPELEDGKQHSYTVRVEVARDGKTLSKTTRTAIKAGQEVVINFSFDERNPAELVASVTSNSSR
jgi:uncharacterized protein (TIGR03000 family)